jgi:hypothetical protein
MTVDEVMAVLSTSNVVQMANNRSIENVMDQCLPHLYVKDCSSLTKQLVESNLSYVVQ